MYDLTGIKDIANGDKDFLVMLIKTFVAEVPPDSDGMTDAINNGNAALAYQFAHKLKPNLLSFGLDIEYDLKVIEDWSQGKADNDQAAQAGKRVNQVVTKVITDLEEDYDL